mmetsp:Transcript_30488/g.76538  ORF Transcript_30488/g.76538 Transcript_30488/m.76538 type:complete len:111 (-) Transcript_30488:28-360(-)
MAHQFRTPIQLYRDLLRLAKLVGKEKNNTEILTGMVRSQFEKHAFETNQTVIKEKMDEGIKVLTNYYLLRANQMLDEQGYDTSGGVVAKEEKTKTKPSSKDSTPSNGKKE